MKITAQNVKSYAIEHGLEEVQLDGIPEGFSFKEPDIRIGEREVEGNYVAFIPLAEWGEKDSEVKARTPFGLQIMYRDTCQKK